MIMQFFSEGEAALGRMRGGMTGLASEDDIETLLPRLDLFSLAGGHEFPATRTVPPSRRPASVPIRNELKTVREQVDHLRA